MIKKYRKKPVVIEAIQYRGGENITSCLNFCDKMIFNPKTNEYEIETLEGNHLVSEGDFIIKGVAGEFYPCKSDIFELTYELVTEEG
jgi:hypothetical protein